MNDVELATLAYDKAKADEQAEWASQFNIGASLIAKKGPDADGITYVKVSPHDVNDLLREVEHAKARRDSVQAIANTQASAIDEVKDYLIENYDDMEMHADAIADLLGIDLTREVEYSVSMSVTVTVTVAPGEDAESLIADNLYVDANHGNITVDDYTVDYSNEA